MSIKYKIDIMQALKEKGYTTYRIRKEKIFGQSTLQDFRDGKPVLSSANLEKLCQILDLQIGDILEYIDDGENIWGLPHSSTIIIAHTLYIVYWYSLQIYSTYTIYILCILYIA